MPAIGSPSMNKITFGKNLGSPGSGRLRCSKARTSFLAPLSAKMVSIYLGSFFGFISSKLLNLAIFPIATRFFASSPIENFQKFHLLQNIVLLLKLAEKEMKRYHDINLNSKHLY